MTPQTALPPTPDGRAAARLLRSLVAPDRHRLLRLALVSFALMAANLLAALLIGRLLDAARSPAVPEADGTAWWRWSAGSLLGGLAACAVLRSLLTARLWRLAGELGERTAGRARELVWGVICRTPSERVRRRGSGRWLLHFTGDARGIQRLAGTALVRSGQDALTMAGILAVLAWLAPALAAAATAVLLGGALTLRRLNPGLRTATRAVRRRRGRLVAWLDRRLRSREAGLLDNDQAELFRRANRRVTREGAGVAVWRGRIQGTGAALGVGCTLAVLAAGLGQVAQGTLTSGDFLSAGFLGALLGTSAERVVSFNRLWQEGVVSLNRLQRLQDSACAAGGPREHTEDEGLPGAETALARLPDPALPPSRAASGANAG